MKITVKQQGKIYEIDSNNKVKVYHTHDALVSVCGEYYKNKYTGEWVSELEYEQSMKYSVDSFLEDLHSKNGSTNYVISDEQLLEQLEEDELNKYY